MVPFSLFFNFKVFTVESFWFLVLLQITTKETFSTFYSITPKNKIAPKRISPNFSYFWEFFLACTEGHGFGVLQKHISVQLPSFFLFSWIPLVFWYSFLICSFWPVLNRFTEEVFLFISMLSFFRTFRSFMIQIWGKFWSVKAFLVNNRLSNFRFWFCFYIVSFNGLAGRKESFDLEYW